MTGWILAAVFAALAIWSVMRVVGLRRQVGRIREQLVEHGRNASAEPLEVLVRDDELERLVAQVELSLQEQRSAAAASAAREKRLRGEIADISHDLKTPLIAVRGYLQLLQRDGPGPTPRRDGWTRCGAGLMILVGWWTTSSRSACWTPASVAWTWSRWMPPRW